MRLRARAAAISLVLALSAAAPACQRSQPRTFPLFEAGVAVQDGSGRATAVPASDRQRRFRPDTRVLAGTGSWSLDRVAAADQAWLAAGTVPGPTDLRAFAVRALLDMRSLTMANGAVLAGWDAPWHYVWPRDASFAAAAYAVTGHPDDASRVLRYLASIAPADGRWQARYLPDGSGDAPDRRGVQADGAGWVLWATGVYASRAAAGTQELTRLWPMVAVSADAIAGSLGSDGLPPPSPDYWEQATGTVTLGVAAPCLAGLGAAVALAERTGHPAEASRWRAAHQRLAAGIAASFGRTGYHRSIGGGFDAAVTFAGPPYLPGSAPVRRALARAYPLLRNPNGGLRPGQDWQHGAAAAVSWTPETAMFALAFAAIGESARATGILAWLSAHTTSLGSLPEKVAPDGAPASVAPLAWTDAIVLLAMSELSPD